MGVRQTLHAVWAHLTPGLQMTTTIPRLFPSACMSFASSTCVGQGRSTMTTQGLAHYCSAWWNFSTPQREGHILFTGAPNLFFLMCCTMPLNPKVLLFACHSVSMPSIIDKTKPFTLLLMAMCNVGAIHCHKFLAPLPLPWQTRTSHPSS